MEEDTATLHYRYSYTTLHYTNIHMDEQMYYKTTTYGFQRQRQRQPHMYYNTTTYGFQTQLQRQRHMDSNDNDIWN